MKEKMKKNVGFFQSCFENEEGYLTEKVKRMIFEVAMEKLLSQTIIAIKAMGIQLNMIDQ